MNTNDNIKNDFIFFQNEILSDIKKLESRLTDKIFQVNNIIQQQNLKNENKINELNSRFIILTNQIDEKKNSENPELIIQPVKQKLEENISKLEIKINLIEKDLGNACFKYDKMMANNLTAPGLIGSSCPYESLRPFLEFVNSKIIELIRAKEKSTFDFKKYKEKLETIINNNKTQFDTAQRKINEYCKNGFKQCDTNCIDRINIIEKRIEALRIENGQFSFDLKQKSEELKIEWEKLDKVEKNLNLRYSEELKKYNGIIEKFKKKIDKSRDEFNLIKMRFTELSEFIKDIRFRTNIHNSFQERKQYKVMSSKIDFTKKQKIKSEEIQENENKNKDIDILAPFDYYAYFGIDRALPEEEENNYNINESNKEDNNNEMNNKNNISNDNQNKNNFIENKKENDIKINDIIIRDDKKYNTQNLYNLYNNKTIDIINNNYVFEIKKNNKTIHINSTNNIQDNNKNDKQNKTKNIERQLINIRKNNKHNINIDHKIINDNNNNAIKNERNIQEKKQQEKKKLLSLKEPTKINDVVLDVQFNNNNMNLKINNNNLSQAYILMKKKTEEMQRIKSIYGGKQELKYHRISSPPSLKHNIKSSRNKDNYILNQFHILSNKEFKKGNIEDLYYSHLKNEKLNNNSNTIIARSSSQDNLNIYYNTIDKRMLPKLFNDNQKIVNSSSINDKLTIDSNRYISYNN